MRRNRRHDWLRRMVRESVLTPADFIWPIFVHDAPDAETPIDTLPGVSRMSIARAVDAVGDAKALGIPSIAVFGAIDGKLKTSTCEEAWNPDNLVCRAVKDIKSAHPDIGIVCDVALDPFNADGHDGIVRNDEVANDETIEALCRQAIVQADAGCDIAAPSDMMDGRVGAIRKSLDDAGHDQIAIMSYAAKYASVFYGPFRDAVDSAGFLKGAGKDTYQMDPANSDEALREVALDIDEGADMIMIKPAFSYLDIIERVKTQFRMPTFAYNVSGEYAMITFAARAGAFDQDTAMMEMLIAFKRAGADGILSYFAPAASRLLGDI